MTTQTAAVLQKSMAAGNGLKDVVAGRTATMTKVFVPRKPGNDCSVGAAPSGARQPRRGGHHSVVATWISARRFPPASLALGLRIETG